MNIFNIFYLFKPKHNQEILPEYEYYFENYSIKFSVMTTEELEEELNPFNYIHLSHTAKLAKYRALKKELEHRKNNNFKSNNLLF